ncbi:MAG: histone deacetylase family protein [Burkholderiales bacterium]
MVETAYFSHPDCRLHQMGRGHPECPQRLDAIDDHLLATGLDMALQRREAPWASEADLLLAHSSAHVERLHALMERVMEFDQPIAVDPDTVFGTGTWLAAMRAAGAAVAATNAVLAGEVRNAFCAARPPGHHATRDQSMGFCFFNNVAIAALHALERHGLQRVAIVDFDVHHGNGTEDIIAGDERVLMVSVFQHPLYPFEGELPKGRNMVNLPLAAYTRGAEMRELIIQHWLPALNRFKPQMIFVSAGFDAHREDDLAQLGWVEADYEWITRRIVEVADQPAQGRIVSCLEGGYNLSALARSVSAHLRVLAGVD